MMKGDKSVFVCEQKTKRYYFVPECEEDGTALRHYLSECRKESGRSSLDEKVCMEALYLLCTKGISPTQIFLKDVLVGNWKVYEEKPKGVRELMEFVSMFEDE